jgi:hypothetical protein
VRERVRLEDRERDVEVQARGAFCAGQPRGGRRETAASAHGRNWHWRVQS